MDALPPARSLADHTPSHSALTAAAAGGGTPGTTASKRVDGAEQAMLEFLNAFLRWLAGALSSIMACGGTVIQHDAAPKRCPGSGIVRSRTWRAPANLDAHSGWHMPWDRSCHKALSSLLSDFTADVLPLT